MIRVFSVIVEVLRGCIIMRLQTSLYRQKQLYLVGGKIKTPKSYFVERNGNFSREKVFGDPPLLRRKGFVKRKSTCQANNWLLPTGPQSVERTWSAKTLVACADRVPHGVEGPWSTKPLRLVPTGYRMG
jgi:hypothetical protein